MTRADISEVKKLIWTSSVYTELVDKDLQFKVNGADPMVKQFVSDILLENKKLHKRIAKNEAQYQSRQNYLTARITELEHELKDRPMATIVIECK